MKQPIEDNLEATKAHEIRARIYEHALVNGPVTAEELRMLPGTDGEATDDAVAQLTALQLLLPVPGHPNRLNAASPLMAQSRVIAPLQQKVTELGHQLLELHTQLNPLQRLHDTLQETQLGSQSLMVISDPQEITSTLEAVTRACEREVLTAQPGGPRSEGILTQALPRDSAMLRRGVRMQTIYQHSARFNGPTQAYVEHVSALGCEVRTLDEFFARLLVFDRRTAFIPDVEDGTAAVLIRHPAVVAFLAGTFKRAFATALPFSSAHESRTNKSISSAMQRSIARLMLTEDKDSAIARRLGIGERTCRAHIARIMTQLGARNRTHLGYLLATADPNLLEETPTEKTFPQST